MSFPPLHTHPPSVPFHFLFHVVPPRPHQARASPSSARSTALLPQQGGPSSATTSPRDSDRSKSRRAMRPGRTVEVWSIVRSILGWSCGVVQRRKVNKVIHNNFKTCIYTWSGLVGVWVGLGSSGVWVGLAVGRASWWFQAR